MELRKELSMDNNRAKELLEQLGNLQVASQSAGLPCPRCGYARMDEKPVRNALSRRAKVHICDMCGMDEAMRDMAGLKPVPLEQWAMILAFDDDKSK